MYTSFAKFLCAAAFAGTALGQNISINLPGGTTLKGGASVAIQLERPPPTDQITDVGLVVTNLACPSGTCTEDYTSLGQTLYSSQFTSKWTDSKGNQFDSFNVTVPDSFNGPALINVANFYLSGAYGKPETDYASITVNIANVGGG